MHKVFTSYHHGNGQEYKEALINSAERYSIFVNRTVSTVASSHTP